MSKNNTNKTVRSSEDRIDLIVGIVTVVLTLALFGWLFFRVATYKPSISAIASSEEIRRGYEQEYTCEVTSDKIKDGEKVIWTINGEVVHEDTYQKGSPLTLNYAMKQTGYQNMMVKVGKFRQYSTINVLPPKLTIEAPNVTVTYGEQLPHLGYNCCGFVDDDNAEMLCCGESCSVCDLDNADVNTDHLNVGVYKIMLKTAAEFKDYDIEYLPGTLTVLPKQLKVTNNFVKTYDKTNVIERPAITLDGVKAGDKVVAKCDKLYFDNKNAGNNKSVMLANVELTGADSGNYVLTGEARGRILPKAVEINGLTIKDKTYDGTTKATIDKMGSLNGVLEGDSVAIGKIDLSFADANLGAQEIVINDVTLIGADKDNYVVDDVTVENANITTTIWNKLFVQNPVVGAAD